MRTFLGCLAAIVLLGCGLRFAYYSIPNEYPDENITVEVVKRMRQTGDWDVNWRLADLPPEFKYDQYNFSSHLYATYFFYRVVKLLPGTLGWRSDRDGFTAYRFLSAFLASIVVLQAVHLGWMAADRQVAIAGGLLTAISVLLVQDAHYVRPEPFMTVLVVAVVALSLPRKGDAYWRPGLAGVAMGLLIACKISMLMLVWIPFVALIPGWRTRRVWVMAAMAIVAIAIGFVAGAPGAVMHPAAFLNGVRKLSEQYHGIHPPHSHWDGRPMWDLMGKYFIASLGWPLIGAFVLGVVALVRKQEWLKLTLLAGPVFVFFGGFATRSVFFERNLSPVMPMLFVVAALGVGAVVDALAPRLRVPAGAMLTALLAIVAFQSASITRRLVVGELGQRRWLEQMVFESELQARYPAAKWDTSILLWSFMPEDLEKHFKTDGREVLLRLTDYRDDWRVPHLKDFNARFRADLLADRPGSFPEIPTGTLLTYHSTTELYYLVHGVK